MSDNPTLKDSLATVYDAAIAAIDSQIARHATVPTSVDILAAAEFLQSVYPDANTSFYKSVLGLILSHAEEIGTPIYNVEEVAL